MSFNFKKRIQSIQKRLSKVKLDSLVILTAEDSNKNVYYLSGFSGTTGVLGISPKNAVLAVDSRYTERARKESVAPGVEIPKGGSRGGRYSLYIEEALSALNLPKGARVGFEASRVPHGWIAEWQKHSHFQFVPTDHFVERHRQVKDAEEIRHLTRAARITSTVFKTVASKIRPGMREADIASLLDIDHLKRGAVAPSFRTIVASGPNSAVPHHETGTRRVKAGDPVVLDVGGLFPGGYCSDLTRTIFVPGARPHPKLAEMYRIALEANKKAFRFLKPGVTWKEYDAVARTHITGKGYGEFFLHGLGHSLGLETHDPYDYANDAFREGTVLSNEPGIYVSGLGGVRIEDDVVVTKNGARRLTVAPYLRV